MTQWFDRGDGVRLAYEFREGCGPVLVFLPGYRSDRLGGKAVALDEWCARQGRAMLRLDYAGHGASEGIFEDGTIGGWTADAAAVIEAVVLGDLVLVGSSMGGWIALLLAGRLAGRLGARVKGVVLIAPAPDFSEELMWAGFSGEEKRAMMEEGGVRMPNPYGEDYVVSRGFIEDGRRHLVMGARIAIGAPVRLMHGQRDDSVPWQTSLRIMELLDSDDVRVTLIKDGDHRLSRPGDIGVLLGFFGEDGL